MSVASARDLRNHTADVLQRASSGETVTITVHGAPVAELRPLGSTLPLYFNRADLLARLSTTQADPALRTELAALLDGSTDDLDDL